MPTRVQTSSARASADCHAHSVHPWPRQWVAPPWITHEVGVEQSCRFVLIAGEHVPVPVERVETFAWPMYVERAFAFTPAAIISEAYVCLASCSPTGSSRAAFQTRCVRRVSRSASNV